jgi:hypothetical protein
MAIFFSLINVYFHLNSAWTSLLTYLRIFIKFSSHYHVVYTIFLNLVSGDQENKTKVYLQKVLPIYLEMYATRNMQFSFEKVK